MLLNFFFAFRINSQFTIEMNFFLTETKRNANKRKKKGNNLCIHLVETGDLSFLIQTSDFMGGFVHSLVRRSICNV